MVLDSLIVKSGVCRMLASNGVAIGCYGLFTGAPNRGIEMEIR